MNDIDTINDAYADAVKGLFRVMMGSYASAQGNESAEKKVDEAFRTGLILTRKVRDRALTMAR